MSVTTVEGIVKDGHIQLPDSIVLPEMSRVYVIIPSGEGRKRVLSPRLVNKDDAVFLEKTVEDDVDDKL